MKKNKIIGIIGCGNMGEAIISRAAKDKSLKFIIFEKDKVREGFVKQTYNVRLAKDISELLSKSNAVILAVKPQDMDMLLAEIRRVIEIIRKKNICIISIAAGIKCSYIEDKLSNKVRVIRVMPNLPAIIGKGISALFKGCYASSLDLRLANKIFSTLGETVIIQKEGLIDIVTALSGSGPAYIFFIINSMLVAAQQLGLDEGTANKLIYHTVIGAAELNKEKKFDAKKLISQIASKGGTTEAALKVFNNKKMSEIIIEAMVAAHRRAKELCR